MKTDFDQMPFCFRLSQCCIGGAAVLGVLASRFFNPIVPVALQYTLVAILVLMILTGLLASVVVLWVCPYISLIEVDNDIFSHFFKPESSLVCRMIGFFATFVFAFNVTVRLALGKFDFTNHSGFVVVYAALLIPFLVFLVFIFKNKTYPTIATFLQATMGLGIILFPLCLPLIIVGGIRCTRMLDDADRLASGTSNTNVTS